MNETDSNDLPHSLQKNDLFQFIQFIHKCNLSLVQTQNSDSVSDGRIRSVDPIVREWTSYLTTMMVNRVHVVWHIYIKERNVHFNIVMKTDPQTLLYFRLSFLVYFALLTIYFTTVQRTEWEKSWENCSKCKIQHKTKSKTPRKVSFHYNGKV